ncbi:MAG: exonuclease domain-containing protein [Betaproteobacteria bacterium]
MTITVMDTETTGLDAAKDKIVEIAGLNLTKVPDGLFRAENIRQHLVDPGMTIPAQASAVHHIIDADVRGKPPIGDIIPFYCAKDRLVVVAHNCDFDRGFLEPEFNECEQAVEWICTYKSALRAWPDLPSHSNQFLRYHFGYIDPLGVSRHEVAAHRAISDCYVTACVFLELLQTVSFANMLRWTKEPALKTRLNFGKHKGDKYIDHPDFCQWILTKDFDASTKFSAQYWLDLANANKTAEDAA